MSTPTITAQISSTPHAAGPSWMSASSRFRSATITRGRSTEFDKVLAGRATFTFSNADRAFDRTYSSSPFYPGLKLERLIQISATWAGVVYPLFTGYIDSIRQAYLGNKESVATITATDAFKVLAGVKLPSSVFEAEVRADNPVAWWRLDEAAGSATVVDSIGHRPAEVIGTPTLGAAGLVNRDPGTAMGLNLMTGGGSGSTDGATSLPGDPILTGLPLTVECIVKSTSLTGGQLVTLVDDAGNMIATLGGDGFSATFLAYGASSSQLVTGTVSIHDDAPHLLTGVWDLAGTMHLYVDGVATGGTASLPAVIPPVAAVWIGGGQSLSGGVLGGMVGTLDEVAVYPTVVSAGRVAAHWAARSTPWAGDRTDARLARILTLIGSNSGERALDAGLTTLPAASLGMSALSHMQAVEMAEGGLLFIQKDGLVRFRSRSGGWNQTTRAIFGDAGTELGYRALTFDETDRLLFNVIRRTRDGGATQEARDQASIDDYYEKSDEQSGYWVTTDAEMLDAANYRLARYKDPVQRIDALELDPTADAANLFPVLLGAELGDQYEVRKRPMGIGSAIDQILRLEGYTLNIAPMKWTASWKLSPAEAAVMFQLDRTSGPGLDQMMLTY